MVNFEQITNSVWSNTEDETFSHVAFVKLNNCLVFIDSGYYPKVIEKARKEAEKITGLPVKYLIITHHHGDHVLGNQFFEDCQIISTKKTFDILDNLVKTRWSDDNLEKTRKENPKEFDILKVVLPNKSFVGEYEIIDDTLSLKIFQTDGHTSGSCFVYFPEERIIIAGDLLFSEQVPYFGDETTDPYLWLEAYKQMIDLNPVKVIPGHGPMTDIEQVKIQLQYLEDCINWMEDYVKSGRKKEDLDAIIDFPMLDYDKYDDFDEFFKLSKDRTYDVVKEKHKH